MRVPMFTSDLGDAIGKELSMSVVDGKVLIASISLARPKVKSPLVVSRNVALLLSWRIFWTKQSMMALTLWSFIIFRRGLKAEYFRQFPASDLFIIQSWNNYLAQHYF